MDNCSGCRSITGGTKANSFCRFSGGSVDMDRPGSAIDEKHLGI